MEIAKVCRICLAMDVKMYDLRTQPLKTWFESITEKVLTTIELPPFVCFICAALLKKYYFFRDRCLEGYTTLYRILDINGKITKEKVQQLNRSRFQSNFYLSSHELLQDNVVYHVYNEGTSFNIKNDCEIDNDYIKFNIKESIKAEQNIHDLPFSIRDDDIKYDSTEECPDEKPKPVKDDESLQFKKSCDVRKGKEKHKDKIDDKKDHIYLANNITAASCKTEVTVELREKPPKLKKALCRKSDVKKQRGTSDVLLGDLEEYVTIVKLSIEEQVEEINKRQQSTNYLNSPYQCKLCYKGFIDTNTWEHHVSKHDPSAGEMECSICKLRFKSKYVLNRHGSNHEKKYICKSCSYVSTSTVQAKRHERWHKGVIYKCKYCDEIFTKWTSYLSHVRIKHPSEFICSICGYSFFSELGLAMHKSRMHKGIHEEVGTEVIDANKTELHCEECNVTFISIEAFQRHTVTSAKHTQTTHFNNGCRECGKTFKNPEELANHRKIHARKMPKYYCKKPTNVPWPLKCEHCSEELSNGRDYWNHYRRSHPDKEYPVQKDYVCDICGKSFKSNTFLVYHKRTHSEERTFKCSTCGKAFHNNGNLQLHQKTHSDARPHACTVCLKAFKCKGALSKHYRRHKGEKPYECHICGKAFTESSGRKLHIRTVHLKQPVPPRSRIQRKKP